MNVLCHYHWICLSGGVQSFTPIFDGKSHGFDPCFFSLNQEPSPRWAFSGWSLDQMSAALPTAALTAFLSLGREFVRKTSEDMSASLGFMHFEFGIT